MPELPEVETIRRQLAPLVEGRTLERLTIDDARWCAPLAPDEVVAAVEGRPVERLGRRGKYLVWTFAGDVHLLVHLRMTGTLLYDPPPGTPYARVRFDLGDGRVDRAQRAVEAGDVLPVAVDLVRLDEVREDEPAVQRVHQPLERAALDERGQLAADGLDLGQLGHRCRPR